MTLQGDNSLIGVIGVTGHLGYWLGKAHWGKGYMTEVAIALIDAYFRGAKSKNIIAGVFQDNAGSQAVLNKLGFTQIGMSRQFCPARNAEVERIAMELGRAAWRERRERRAA